MLPCENSLAGRVPDIHHLLPESGLFVVGEHFQRVEHCLLATKGADIAGLKRAHSHPVALGQVRGLLRELRLQPVRRRIPPGAAQLVARARRSGRRRHRLLARRRDLRPRRAARGTWRTRRTTPRASTSWRESPRHTHPDAPDLMTTFVFRVRNVPAALYKALGGFATNAVNMTKLESYMVGGQLHRDAVPVRRGGTSRAAAAAPCARGAVVLLERGARARRLSGRAVPAGTGGDEGD